MTVLLVRHSDAIAGDSQLDDASRWLSERGREKARKVARALRKTGLTFDRFVTSPRVRAVQTAELFAQVISFAGIVEVVPALCFEESPERAADTLRKLSGTTAAFGHMPTLEAVATSLCGGTRVGSFATSEARWIHEGRVVWSIDPGKLLGSAP
jgi:phosphohistidine phosphatase